MLPGRKPTEDEERYLDDVAQLGCIICRLYLCLVNEHSSPAEIHHVDGKTKEGCHFKVIPLCDKHHRLAGKGYCSRANGKRAFEQAYMPEEDLIEVTRKAVELQRSKTIGRRG